MPIRVVFLGKLADLAGVMQSEVPAPIDWAGLLDALPASLSDMVAGPKVRAALNGDVLADKTSLIAQEGDEIALLPPVSGG